MTDLPHARFYLSEVDSPSWRALDANAVALLLTLRLLYKPGCDGMVFLTVREAMKRLSVSQRPAQRAFKALRANGWIEYADAAGPAIIGLPRKIWLRVLLPDGSTEPYADHVPAGM